MSLPDKLTICGFTYEIKIVDRVDDESSLGSCNVGAQLILINELAQGKMKLCTLIHEIIEAINYHYGVDLKHRQITALDHALLQVIVDNMKEIKKLMS